MARHDFSAKLIGPTASQSMAQQRGSHFEWDSEILQPGGEGVAEIVKWRSVTFASLLNRRQNVQKAAAFHRLKIFRSTWTRSRLRAS